METPLKCHCLAAGLSWPFAALLQLVIIMKSVNYLLLFTDVPIEFSQNLRLLQKLKNSAIGCRIAMVKCSL